MYKRLNNLTGKGLKERRKYPNQPQKIKANQETIIQI